LQDRARPAREGIRFHISSFRINKSRSEASGPPFDEGKINASNAASFVRYRTEPAHQLKQLKNRNRHWRLSNQPVR
jgi:hypothetical protein